MMKELYKDCKKWRVLSDGKKKKRKTKLCWLSQLDYTRVWTKVHVWLFCCTALHRCSLWLSQFSCLKTWRKTASHFLFQDANSNKQLMIVFPALATLWNTWAIIAIIIRRIIINLQLCDEAIKGRAWSMWQRSHTHSPSFGEPPWHLYQSVY